MTPGDLVMHIADDPENIGLVIEARPQTGGHDHASSLVLWTGETRPIWEKNFLLVKVNQEKKN